MLGRPSIADNRRLPQYIPIQEQYALPSNHHEALKVAHTVDDYYYCSRCFVPPSCKAMLHGEYKESNDDGAIFAGHVLSLMCSSDPESHEICLNEAIKFGEVNGMKLGSALNQRHLSEIEDQIISFVWETAPPEVGALIDNYFDAEAAAHNKEPPPLHEASSSSKEEKKDDSLPQENQRRPSSDAASSVHACTPRALSGTPAVSVLVATLSHRLDNKCWGAATSVVALLSSLTLAAPYYSDRCPSKCKPHSHMHLQDTGDPTFELCQAVVASGGDKVLAKGFNMLCRGQNEERLAILSATGPDGQTLLAQLCKCIGRLCLSHESLRDCIVKNVVKDRTSAGAVVGSRAGGESSRGSTSSRRASTSGGIGSGGGTSRDKRAVAFENIWWVLIEALSNGVRSFTGQGSDGLGVQYSLMVSPSSPSEALYFFSGG